MVQNSHSRLVFALSFLVGQRVSVSLEDGGIIEGTLVGGNVSTSFIGVSLRYCVSGTTLLESCNIPWSNTKEIFALNGGDMVNRVVRPDLATKAFQTDSDISSHGKTTERQLTSTHGAWLSGDGGSLNDGDASGFNQFKTNEEKFGVKSTFDERLYTTELNMSAITSEQRMKASAIARDIETKSSTNFYVQEERGQLESDPFHGDEEARFSSVIRDPKAYKPPHRANENIVETHVKKETPKVLNPVAKEWKPSVEAKSFVPNKIAQAHEMHHPHPVMIQSPQYGIPPMGYHYTESYGYPVYDHHVYPPQYQPPYPPS